MEDGLGATREKVFGWLKSKFTKPAQTAAVEVAVHSPGDADALAALQLQLKLLLERDEAFRKELLALLPKEALPPGLTQTTQVTGGNENVIIQSAGSGNVSVQR